jgi:hypothetical protein
LSSSSRTAGLLTVGSTFTTSTLGTSSGRSPDGASAKRERPVVAPRFFTSSTAAPASELGTTPVGPSL